MLFDILRIWRQMEDVVPVHQERLDELLAQRGLVRRVLGGRRLQVRYPTVSKEALMSQRDIGRSRQA